MGGFKTVIFGVLLALTAIFSTPEMQAFISENIPAVGGAIGTIVVILRFLTASPIFSSAKGDKPIEPKD